MSLELRKFWRPKNLWCYNYVPYWINKALPKYKIWNYSKDVIFLNAWLWGVIHFIPIYADVGVPWQLLNTEDKSFYSRICYYLLFIIEPEKVICHLILWSNTWNNKIYIINLVFASCLMKRYRITTWLVFTTILIPTIWEQICLIHTPLQGFISLSLCS